MIISVLSYIYLVVYSKSLNSTLTSKKKSNVPEPKYGITVIVILTLIVSGISILNTTDYNVAILKDSDTEFLTEYRTDVENRFDYPLEPVEILTDYGWSGGNFHKGIDIGGYIEGDPVYPTKEGVIIDSGFNRVGGYYVIIEHADGFKSEYYHMSSIDTTIKYVTKNDVIGYVGNTGVFSKLMLHFEIFKKNEYSVYESVNPHDVISGEYFLGKETETAGDVVHLVLDGKLNLITKYEKIIGYEITPTDSLNVFAPADSLVVEVNALDNQVEVLLLHANDYVSIIKGNLELNIEVGDSLKTHEVLGRLKNESETVEQYITSTVTTMFENRKRIQRDEYYDISEFLGYKLPFNLSLFDFENGFAVPVYTYLKDEKPDGSYTFTSMNPGNHKVFPVRDGVVIDIGETEPTPDYLKSSYIIIRHDDYIWSYIANVENIEVEIGDSVSVNESIAVLDNDIRELYLEIKEGNRFEDSKNVDSLDVFFSGGYFSDFYDQHFVGKYYSRFSNSTIEEERIITEPILNKNIADYVIEEEDGKTYFSTYVDTRYDYGYYFSNVTSGIVREIIEEDGVYSIIMKHYDGFVSKIYGFDEPLVEEGDIVILNDFIGVVTETRNIVIELYEDESLDDKVLIEDYFNFNSTNHFFKIYH
jgi:murein DD-endopeptidase MepM/ murein hydrolase activator NlpD